MELRELAERILFSTSIEDKLSAPAELGDLDPGAPRFIEQPARPPALAIRRVRDAHVPPIEGMADAAQRPRIIHAMANHELQAVELFAWALLAFPGAPAEFRRGLARVLADEQRHTRMYIARLEDHGAALGDFPVSGYFWNKIRSVRTPAGFVSTMALTFENANLDHTLDYAAAARLAGDQKTAAVLDAVHRDEIEHVRFGWRWLAALKAPAESMRDAYSRSVSWPLRAELARGPRFHRPSREEAGIDDDFIDMLESREGRGEPDRSGGGPR
jgi:uncharacterized ferritin-like protein (DUF455 family)